MALSFNDNDFYAITHYVGDDPHRVETIGLKFISQQGTVRRGYVYTFGQCDDDGDFSTIRLTLAPPCNVCHRVGHIMRNKKSGKPEVRKVKMTQERMAVATTRWKNTGCTSKLEEARGVAGGASKHDGKGGMRRSRRKKRRKQKTRRRRKKTVGKRKKRRRRT